MDRRTFLEGSLAAISTAEVISKAQSLNAKSPPTTTADGQVKPSSEKLRGVNLGGWLVLEKWMVPNVFKGTEAPDEYELCLALGKAAKARLDRHRDTFITADDFRWIKDRGLNAIRLPVGYWVLQAPPSFVEGARYIDFAFEQAQRNGLKILLELHGAPGSQNGWDHSGRSGTLGWHTSERNIQDTLNVLEELAKRYGKHPAICGIGLLNEPRGDVPIDSLKKFYQDSYSRIRKHTGAGVEIVMHDAFRASEWKGFMQPPAYSHVQLDTHLYQCFTDEDRKRTVQEHVAFAFDRKKHLDMMSKELPTIVGEWSIALPPEVYRGLSPVQASNAKRAYGAAQLLNYESTQGWFYWSYKLEGTSDWSFRQCVENGWLPNNLAA